MSLYRIDPAKLKLSVHSHDRSAMRAHQLSTVWLSRDAARFAEADQSCQFSAASAIGRQAKDVVEGAYERERVPTPGLKVAAEEENLVEAIQERVDRWVRESEKGAYCPFLNVASPHGRKPCFVLPRLA